jgi:hypothetical protein
MQSNFYCLGTEKVKEISKLKLDFKLFSQKNTALMTLAALIVYNEFESA